MKRLLCLAAIATAWACAGTVQAGGWTPRRTPRGPFATSSPPAPPVVVVNASGHAV